MNITNKVFNNNIYMINMFISKTIRNDVNKKLFDNHIEIKISS